MELKTEFSDPSAYALIPVKLVLHSIYVYKPLFMYTQKIKS